jgi:hypothetical protein
VSAQPEVCDGKDNDCDNVTDNGLRPPVAVACWTNSNNQLVCSDPSATSVAPLATVQLDGRMSSDPDSQPLSYAWRIASAPPGSTIAISNPSSSRPTLFAQIAGDYRVCLIVTDSTSCQSTESCVTMHVVPTSRLHVQLVWEKDETDLDLHVMQSGLANFFDDGSGPPGGQINCARAKDCFFVCKVPNWGGGGGADDPRLDIDDIDGFGPENVNLDAPSNGRYAIAVHYWCDRPGPLYDGAGRGNTKATVRIYVDGVLARTFERTIGKDDRWYVADVDWTNGNLPPFVVTSRDSVDTFLGGCP